LLLGHMEELKKQFVEVFINDVYLRLIMQEMVLRQMALTS